MILIIANLVQVVSRVLVFIVIVDIILSYFVPPHHQIRIALDRIVEPMLAPIRRFVPAVSGIDFSPLILVILIQVVEYLIISILI
jgi:YggT family protein